jgi:hypothetical protein
VEAGLDVSESEKIGEIERQREGQQQPRQRRVAEHGRAPSRRERERWALGDEGERCCCCTLMV